MAEALGAPAELGPPELLTLGTELLRVLTTGDTVGLRELLSSEGRGDGPVAININGTSPGAVAPAPAPPPGTSCLLGVTSGGNTALHLAASRGHAGVVALICERAPSLAATRSRCLDTPLHVAARAGHREVAECLLSTMRAGGEEAAAALRARNSLGATALYEAVRHGRDGVVDLFMDVSPELASVTTNNDGVSALYTAAMCESEPMVRALLRPSPDGAPSLASFAGREGRTALHAASTCSTEMVREILAWEPDGSNFLTRIDSSGRSALHLAVLYHKPAVVELLLTVEASLARTSDNQGLFPLHAAAMEGSKRIIDVFITKCPDYSEIVDAKGRNFLHCAVEHNQVKVIRHICRNDQLRSLLNSIDAEGNTPLHLAVKYGHPRVVSLLLQTMSVEIGIVNNDGMTARDLAYIELEPGLNYFLSPRCIICSSLRWVRAPLTLEGYLSYRALEDDKLQVEEELKRHDKRTSTGTIASVLIASATFAAASAVLSADHPDAASTLARRLALGAFVVTDTMAFVCSIIATCFLIYGGKRSVPLDQRDCYQWLASGLVPMGAQFMIGAFAFSVHVVRGAGHRWFTSFVYVVCAPSVLFCFPGIWAPLRFGMGKAVWRRAGWRGLTGIYQRPSSLQELIYYCLRGGFLFPNLRRTFFPLLICAAFLVCVTLDFALPNH